MKRIFILFTAAFSIIACTANLSDEGKKADTVLTSGTSGNSQETLCFQKLSGTSNQDTARIKLIVEADQVRGDFSNIPYEKDSRIGTIQAKKDGDLIKGLWIYMQEGMSDTLEVEFMLMDKKLVQKNYTIDAGTGREVISEASVFNIEFTQVECRN